MPIYSPDIVAYSGRRSSRIFVGNTTDAIISNLNQVMLAGGWEQVGTGVISGHTYYDMLSQQSPWIAGGAPPVDYIAKVKARIYFLNSTHCNIRASNADESIIQTNQGTEITFVTSATPYLAVACPYQLVCWMPGFLDLSFPTAGIISALHTPKFLQSSFGLRECFVSFNANGFRNTLTNLGGNANGFFAVKDNAGIFSWQGSGDDNTRLRMVTVAAGNLDGISGTRVANLFDDPNLVNPALWFPLFIPPMVAWDRAGSVGPPRMLGWFWDAFMLSKSYADQTIITVPDGHSATNITVNNTGGFSSLPGTLFFMTTPAVDT